LAGRHWRVPPFRGFVAAARGARYDSITLGTGIEFDLDQGAAALLPAATGYR